MYVHNFYIMPKGRILIVEDEHIVAKYVQDVLESIGYEVVACVSSGEDAIREAKGKKVDLVLMDIVLKGKMDGIETARYLTEHFGIPVVYITAYADESTIERAKDTECLGYLIKPFDEKDIHVTVELALHRYKTKKQLKKPVRRIVGALNKDELKVFLFFTVYSNTENWVHIPLSKIAIEVNSNAGNVSKAIKSLRQKGYIEVMRKGRENYYRLPKGTYAEEFL